MRQVNRHRARGFALLEMLFCIFAMAMIVIVSGRLFYQLGRIYRQVPESMNAIRSDEQWLQYIRADAWSARNVALAEQGILTFTTADGSVRWSAVSGYLRREEGELIQKWPMSDPIAFKREGGVWLVQAKGASIALAQVNRGGE